MWQTGQLLDVSVTIDDAVGRYEPHPPLQLWILAVQWETLEEWTTPECVHRLSEQELLFSSSLLLCAFCRLNTQSQVRRSSSCLSDPRRSLTCCDLSPCVLLLAAGTEELDVLLLSVLLLQPPFFQCSCGSVTFSILHFLDRLSFILFHLPTDHLMVNSVRLDKCLTCHSWGLTFIMVSRAYFFSCCCFSVLALDWADSFSWFLSSAVCLISFFFSLLSDIQRRRERTISFLLSLSHTDPIDAL